MRFFQGVFAYSIVLLIKNASSSEEAVFRPVQVAYKDLLHTSEWSEELRTNGIVSISQVPAFKKKIEILKALSSCVKESKTTQENIFNDGTKRTTMAGHSRGSSLGSMYDESDCSLLLDETTTMDFRRSVGDTSTLIAKRLNDILQWDQALLKDENDRDYTFEDVVVEGEHLEHFHVYEKGETHVDETIEWHIDQGLFLLFTPGLVDGATTDDFFIQLADGSTAIVQFQASDDLVLLMGDGVNQYVNQALSSRPLRAVPHTLRMSPTDNRVWYGRMVLPPPQCIHPMHAKSFGTLRDDMMMPSSSEETLLLGCSSTLRARELMEVTCDPETAKYCWHRCMNYTDYNVTTELCAEDGLDLACVNDDGFLWHEKHDPQFKLGCADLETAQVFSEETEATETKNESSSGASFLTAALMAIVAVCVVLV